MKKQSKNNPKTETFFLLFFYLGVFFTFLWVFGIIFLDSHLITIPSFFARSVTLFPMSMQAVLQLWFLQVYLQKKVMHTGSAPLCIILERERKYDRENSIKSLKAQTLHTTIAWENFQSFSFCFLERKKEKKKLDLGKQFWDVINLLSRKIKNGFFILFYILQIVMRRE